jgi:hypothetical protein
MHWLKQRLSRRCRMIRIILKKLRKCCSLGGLEFDTPKLT